MRITCAFALPLIRNEPDSISSPLCFTIGSLSPVIRLSFTSQSPSTAMQSEQTCLPADRIIISSRTISFTAIVCVSPFLSTSALGAEIRASLSMALFERISWNIPIAVLHMITPKNRQFLNEPTATTKAASIMLIRLKNVRQLSLNICFTDLLGILKSPLTLPQEIRSFTCSAVSPVVTSVIFSSEVYSSGFDIYELSFRNYSFCVVLFSEISLLLFSVCVSVLSIYLT